MDPEMAFDFGEENVKQIVELLLSLKTSAIDVGGVSTYFLFDVLASVIIEALKFAQVIPHSQEGELPRIKKEIANCTRMRATLGKYLK